jgi:8-oxo-dGTP pyrophosphatase MutT (NUDIX family)
VISPRPQVGALPYRVTPSGLEFLLVTSASRGRWIIPKGNIEPHLGLRESAVAEAREEGGVTGRAHATALGTFINHRPGDPTQITVYPVRVESVISDERWEERHVRKRRWVRPNEAMELVEEEDLRLLLRMAEELLG